MGKRPGFDYHDDPIHAGTFMDDVEKAMAEDAEAARRPLRPPTRKLALRVPTSALQERPEAFRLEPTTRRLLKQVFGDAID